MIHNNDIRPTIIREIFISYRISGLCKSFPYIFHSIRVYLNKRRNMFVDQRVNNILLESCKDIDEYLLFDLLSNYPIIYVTDYIIIKKIIFMMVEIIVRSIIILITIYGLFDIFNGNNNTVFPYMMIADFLTKITIIRILIPLIEKIGNTRFDNLQIFNKVNCNSVFIFILLLISLTISLTTFICFYYLYKTILSKIILILIKNCV